MENDFDFLNELGVLTRTLVKLLGWLIVIAIIIHITMLVIAASGIM